VFNVLKGWFGEKLTTFGMWVGLDAVTYRRIDNVIIPSAHGTTQIDHVLVSSFGVFVIETKNISGWIFGGEKDATWCQSLYGHKCRFQNPLRQNFRHVQCLKEFLGLDDRYFHSVVFFIGECEFKTSMPPNVLSSGLCSYVKSFQTPILESSKVTEIELRLRQIKQHGGFTKSDHLASLDRRHSSTEICPKCGGQMILRRSKKTGEEFLGCASFPRCRHTIWNEKRSIGRV
jgi:restriction system protein